jgi:hypothetical protein
MAYMAPPIRAELAHIPPALYYLLSHCVPNSNNVGNKNSKIYAPRLRVVYIGKLTNGFALLNRP